MKSNLSSQPHLRSAFSAKLSIIGLVLLALLLVNRNCAADTVYTSNGSKQDLSTAGGFNTGGGTAGAITSNDDLVFDNSSTGTRTAYTNINTISAGSLNDTATAVINISGGALNGGKNGVINLGNNSGNSYAPSTSDLIYVGSGATFQLYALTGDTETINLASSGNFDVAGTLNLGLSGDTLAISSATGTQTVTFTGVGTTNLYGTITGVNLLSTAGAFVEQSAGVIAGGGTFTENNTGGTSTLGGANTYTGATTVSAGTLSLTGSLSGSSVTVSGGTLSEASTGVIGGSASLTYNSAGITSTLAGANTYTGATTVSAGTLSLTGSLSGSSVTVSGGTLSEASTGVIGGSASLTYNSAGITSTLAGANTYTGATEVVNGTLLVTGSIANSVTTTVDAGGTLQVGTGANLTFSNAVTDNNLVQSTVATAHTVTLAG